MEYQMAADMQVSELEQKLLAAWSSRNKEGFPAYRLKVTAICRAAEIAAAEGISFPEPKANGFGRISWQREHGTDYVVLFGNDAMFLCQVTKCRYQDAPTPYYTGRYLCSGTAEEFPQLLLQQLTPAS
jgi:hypothetical protein